MKINILLLIITIDRLSAKKGTTTEKPIKGHNYASIHDFPYETFLCIDNMEGGKSYCGGAIMSSTHILTSAQCCSNFSQMYIFAGVSDVSDSKVKDVQQFTLLQDDVVAHENYDPKTGLNDICLINLRTPAKFHDNVKMVTLPEEDNNPNQYSFKMANVSGWGLTNEVENKCLKLQSNLISVYLHNLCYLGYGLTTWFSESAVPNSFICTGDIEYDHSCKIGKGDPLTLRNAKGKRILIGLASRHIGSCPIYSPGTVLYTYVPAYISWISTQIANDKIQITDTYYY